MLYYKVLKGEKPLSFPIYAETSETGWTRGQRRRR